MTDEMVPSGAPAVLLTGASGALGRAIAGELRAARAQVTLTARSETSLARHYRERDADVLLLDADLTDEGSAHAIVSRHMRQFGRIDAVIHAAGKSAHGRLEGQPAEEITELIAINLLAPIRLTHAALGALCLTARRTGFASNVYVGSIAAVVHPANQAVYTAAKSGLVGFSLALHKQLKPEGVECVVVSPGSLGTIHRRSEDLPTHLVDPVKVAHTVASLALGNKNRERHVVIHAPKWRGVSEPERSARPGEDDRYS